MPTREHPRRILFFLSILGVVAYGALLIEHFAPGVGGSDSAGHANAARAIVSGRIVEPIEALDLLELPDRFALAFIPVSHEPGPRPRTMVPRHSPGFALHVALGSLVAGWDAGPLIVSPVAAIVCLLLLFLLGRELELSRPFAFVGAAILASCPVFLFQAVQPTADVAATMWAVASVFFALRSRRSDRWALAAGAALGMAVLVRPANLLLLLPLAFALNWRPKALAKFVLGGLPFAAFFGAWNQAAYGGVLCLGASGQLAGELALANVLPRLRHYAQWLTVQLSPLIPLGWVGVAVDRRVPARERAMLVLWFAPLLLFSCLLGGPFEEWWHTRALLPAVPALILGALLAARDLLRLLPEPEDRPRLRLPALAALLLLTLVGAAEWSSYRRLRPLEAAKGEAVFSEASRALASRAEGGKAVVVSTELSGALRYYTEMIPVRWDRITPEDLDILRAKAAEKGYRIFAALLPHEKKPAQSRLPGPWASLGSVKTASLWELSPAP
ncbi:MAG: glycosyltransferase family 39 protein [Thermoanaerobaculia bacterium]